MVRLFGKSSEREEVEQYVAAAMPRLMGLARAMTGNQADAEDLVQDTLVTVVLKWPRIAHARHIDAYVRRTMVNTLISKKRKRSSTEVISHEMVTADYMQPASAGVEKGVSERELMLGLVAQLPDRQRAVIALRYYEDLPDSDIADALDCSEQAVRSAAHNAMKALRRLLPEHPGTEVGT